jgi:nucleoside-diphosphate-sugar epimerase
MCWKPQERTKSNDTCTTGVASVYQTNRQTDPNIKGLREEDAYPADPDNLYRSEKLYAEKMCEAY